MKLLFRRPLRPSRNSRYLSLDLSHNAARCVALELRFPAGSATGSMSMELYPHLKVRACLDLSWMEKARGSHPRIPGVGFTCNSGPVVRASEIRALAIYIQGAPAGFKLKLGRLRLSAGPQPCGPLPPPRKLVDPLGQSILHTWPGKKERLDPAGPERVPLQIQAKPGRWKVVKEKGRYWLRTPSGENLFSAGVNCMRPFSAGPVKGMERLHAWIPPTSGGLSAAWMDEVRNGVSFYTANLIRRYGADWKRRWTQLAIARLQDWGFNTIGNWSHPMAWEPKGLYYTANAEGWDERPQGEQWGLYNGFPDVFSRAFAAKCRKRARKLARPDDPLLIGYFVLNEPPWQREQYHLARLALETDRAPATRGALRAWLKRKYGTPHAAPTQADLDAMRELMVDKYFATCCAALRKADPNHLLLGIRFYGIPPKFLLKAMRHMDVVSLNNYKPRPNEKMMRALHKATGKPLMLGEFHMGCYDRGMHTGLVGAASQAERAKAYSLYMEQSAKLPYCVGAHWFQYVDQSVLGRFDGENYAIGLVDVTDAPYPELAAAAAKSNRRLAAIHAGKAKAASRPFKRAPEGYAWL